MASLKDRVTDIVEQRFGKAAAVSVDHDPSGIYARAWNAKGEVIAASGPSETETAALTNLRAAILSPKPPEPLLTPAMVDATLDIALGDELAPHDDESRGPQVRGAGS